MSFYDYFFPEQAQASHLRQIAHSASLSQTQSRITRAQVERSSLTNKKRLDELEDELARMTIIMEGLLELFDEKGSVTRIELARKVGEIDARDGKIDGRITPPAEEAEKDKKPDTKFHFPSE